MGCEGVQIQPNCCCRSGRYELVSGPPCFLTDIEISGDISLLSQIDILFLGFDTGGPAACDKVCIYPAPFQVALKAWVEAGGRLFFKSVPILCFNLPDPDNVARYNALLGFLGTGMQLSANIPLGCSADGCFDAASEPIGIMNGLTSPLNYNYNGEISGGTPWAKSFAPTPGTDCNVPRVFVAAEQIGSGLVVAASAFYLWNVCDSNCQFYQRLCKWTVDRIMAV